MKGVGAKIMELLRTISMGKFATKLYYKGKGYKGSVAIGILTVIITSFLVVYAVLLFWEIINR
jgi:hypothetical protein